MLRALSKDKAASVDRFSRTLVQKQLLYFLLVHGHLPIKCVNLLFPVRRFIIIIAMLVQCQDPFDLALGFIKTRIIAAVLIFMIGIIRLHPSRCTSTARTTTLGFAARNSRHVLSPSHNEQTCLVGERSIIFLSVLLDSSLKDLLVLLLREIRWVGMVTIGRWGVSYRLSFRHNLVN